MITLYRHTDDPSSECQVGNAGTPTNFHLVLLPNSDCENRRARRLRIVTISDSTIELVFFQDLYSTRHGRCGSAGQSTGTYSRAIGVLARRTQTCALASAAQKSGFSKSPSKFPPQFRFVLCGDFDFDRFHNLSRTLTTVLYYSRCGGA